MEPSIYLKYFTILFYFQQQINPIILQYIMKQHNTRADIPTRMSYYFHNKSIFNNTNTFITITLITNLYYKVGGAQSSKFLWTNLDQPCNPGHKSSPGLQPNIPTIIPTITYSNHN